MNPKSTNPNRVQMASITSALWSDFVADLGAGWSISEIYGSDDLSEGVPTKRYLSEGNTNSFEIESAILRLSPWGFLGIDNHFYYRKKPTISHVAETVDAFEITVGYTEKNDKEETDPGEPWSRTVNVSVSLEPEHRQTSLETVNKAGKREQSGSSYTDQPAPDCKGAVNVSPTAIEGYEVGIPRITITFDIETPDLTDAQLKSLYSECGTVNNAAIFGRAIGEVLYSGFTYSKTAFHKTSLHFEFQVRKNEQNIQPPNNLAPIPNKEGWQYLWFYLIEETDTTTNTTVTRPIAWFLERVYEKSAWTNTKSITGTTLALQTITGPAQL